MDISCDHIYHHPVISYINSKNWRRPLLNFASCISWQQSRQPMKLPHPKPRSARTCALSVTEECEVVEKQMLRSTPEIETPGTSQVTASLTRQMLPDPKEEQVTHCCATNSGVQIFTLGRYQVWKRYLRCNQVLPCVVRLLNNTVVNERDWIHLVYFWNKPKCMLPVLSPPVYLITYATMQLYVHSDSKRCELQSKQYSLLHQSS
jgi:hypothetical protein